MTSTRRASAFFVLACLLPLAACTTSSSPDPSGPSDAGVDGAIAPDGGAPDGPTPDGGAHEAGLPAVDIDAVFRACGFAASCPGTQAALGAVDGCTKKLLAAKARVAPDPPPVFQSLTADQLLACAAPAKSCADWLACTTAPYGPDYCAQHPGDSCDGNTAVSCASANVGGIPTKCGDAYPCTMVGQTALCTNGASCSFPQADCEGNLITGCASGGKKTGEECAPGFSCAYGPPPGPHIASCVASLGSSGCTALGVSCSGAVSQYCVQSSLGGAPSGRYDCAALGLSCDATATSAAYFASCALAAPECDDHADAATCNGNTMRWCIAGHWRTFDCATMGLRCDATHGDPGSCQ